MFYGLAHLEESYYVDSLLKAVTLAPCFVSTDSAASELADWEKMAELGVHSIMGPNWNSDVKTICENLSQVTCWNLKLTAASNFAQAYSVQD